MKSYGLAYEVCPDNVQALERLGEIYESLEDPATPRCGR